MMIVEMDIQRNKNKGMTIGGVLLLGGAVGAALSFYYDGKVVERQKQSGDLEETTRTLLLGGQVIGILTAVAGVFVLMGLI